MNEELQLAESHKYDSSMVWHFAELRSNLFALYGYDRQNEPFITNDWNEILRIYRERPVYVPRPRLVLERAGIDLSRLEIRL